MHERRLPRSRHPRDHRQRVQRDLHVDPGQVVQAGALDAEPRPVHLPQPGPGRIELARQIAGGGGAGPGRRVSPAALPAGGADGRAGAGTGRAPDQLLDRALEHDLAALLAAGGPQLHDVVGPPDHRRVVLHHQHGVAGVPELLQEPDQPVVVPGVQPDGRLVQDVERVHERRAQRVGQGDPLRLAPAERPGLPVQGQVAEPDVVQEREPGPDLPEDGRRQRRLRIPELEGVEPGPELRDPECGHRADVAAADLHGQRFGSEPRAAARRAGPRHLVLPQEDPDVGLVALPLPGPEERDHALEAPALPLPLHAVDHVATEPLRQLAPRRVQVHAPLLRELEQPRPVALPVPLHLPRLHRALPERPLRHRHDQRLVVLQHRAEARALLARAVRVVEREQPRRRIEELELRMTLAAEPLAEPHRPAPRLPAAVDHHHALPLPLGEGGADGVGEPLPALRVDLQPVHHDLYRRLRREIVPQPAGVGRVGLVQHQRVVAGQDPDEAHLPEVLHHPLVAGPGAQRERERDDDPGPRLQREHGVRGALHRVRPDLLAALGAVRAAGPGPEEPEVVVDLGGRAHGRPAGLGRVLLLDGDRRRDPLDRVDRRLLHPLQELLGVGGEGLHVAALPLGVDGVEGQRALARPARPRHHDEPAVREVEVDPLQVVLPRVADGDPVFQASPGVGLSLERANGDTTPVGAEGAAEQASGAGRRVPVRAAGRRPPDGAAGGAGTGKADVRASADPHRREVRPGFRESTGVAPVRPHDPDLVVARWRGPGGSGRDRDPPLPRRKALQHRG